MVSKNIDKIKNKTLEEMIDFIYIEDCYYCYARGICKIWNEGETNTTEGCRKYLKLWLESEE